MISRVMHWQNEEAMLEKVFTERERRYCASNKYPHKRIASIFAVKEAFMKAVGTGWSKGVQWKDIEVLCESRTASVRLHNKAKELCNGRKVFASTGCAGDLAVAMVVISDGV